MTFKLPKGVTYTQMAIYVDEHYFLPNRDDNLIFEYLYHLIYMLARKKQFFQKSSQYDEYSIFAATKVFMRLIDKRCYEENPSMPLVKSCLNYIKKT